MEEKQIIPGDKIQLLVDRGFNKKGDILTVGQTKMDIIITEEMFDINMAHHINIGDSRTYKLIEEMQYEIY